MTDRTILDPIWNDLRRAFNKALRRRVAWWQSRLEDRTQLRHELYQALQDVTDWQDRDAAIAAAESHFRDRTEALSHQSHPTGFAVWLSIVIPILIAVIPILVDHVLAWLRERNQPHQFHEVTP